MVCISTNAQVKVKSGGKIGIGTLDFANISVLDGGKLTIRNSGIVRISNDEITIEPGGVFELVDGEIIVLTE